MRRHACPLRRRRGRDDDSSGTLTTPRRFTQGATPLIYAATRGHEDCITALCEAGADVSLSTVRIDE